jgi:hypothetical protein
MISIFVVRIETVTLWLVDWLKTLVGSHLQNGIEFDHEHRLPTNHPIDLADASGIMEGG